MSLVNSLLAFIKLINYVLEMAWLTFEFLRAQWQNTAVKSMKAWGSNSEFYLCFSVFHVAKLKTPFFKLRFSKCNLF